MKIIHFVLLTIIATAIAGDVYFYKCKEVAFCTRYVDFESVQLNRKISFEEYPKSLMTQFNGAQHYSVSLESIKNNAF